MYNYNWTIYDLEERLNKLIKLSQKTKDINKLKLIDFDITSLETTIEEMENCENITNLKLIDKYRVAKENLENIKFLWGDIKYANEHNRIEFNTLPIPKKCSLSKEDILDLTHDFYKHALDRYFYGNFMKNFYRRKDHLAFFNDENSIDIGNTLPILSLKESFITINRNKTYVDLFTAVHEYGHATSAIINPYHLMDEEKSVFAEVDSIFMEILAIDYFSKHLKDDNVFITGADNYLNRYYQTKNTALKIALVEKEQNEKTEFKNKKKIKKVASKIKEINEFDNLDLLLSDYNTEDYTIGQMFATELFMQYKEDPEKSLDMLKKFIMMNKNSTQEYFNNILNLGIYPNENYERYQRYIVTNLNNITRKREIKNKIAK